MVADSDLFLVAAPADTGDGQGEENGVDGGPDHTVDGGTVVIRVGLALGDWEVNRWGLKEEEETSDEEGKPAEDAHPGAEDTAALEGTHVGGLYGSGPREDGVGCFFVGDVFLLGGCGHRG